MAREPKTMNGKGRKKGFQPSAMLAVEDFSRNTSQTQKVFYGAFCCPHHEKEIPEIGNTPGESLHCPIRR